MENKNYVVGIGEALLDCFVDNETKLETRKLGGAPTIFAYHAVQSRWEGMVISAIGNDDEGKTIKDEIEKKHKLKSHLESIEGKDSGVVSVRYKNGDRNNPEYTIDPNSAWSEMSYFDELSDIARHTKAVYFGTLASHCGTKTKNTIDSFLKEVSKDGNNLIIYDVNLRTNPEPKKVDLFNDELIIEYMGKCNVLKVNRYELGYICKLIGIKDEESERKKCLEIMNVYKRIKYLIVTMGEDGSSIFWRDKDHNNKIAYSSLGMPLDVENTVGAGDALAGAFIGEILRNKTPEHAHRIAVQRSAIVCEEGDSMPPIIRRDVFISYSRKDKDAVAKHFCHHFKENGLSVWRDEEEIEHGDELRPEIKQAIRSCEVVVYFSSKDANKSDWVTKEVLYAIKNNKTVIPVKLDDAPINETINKSLNDIDQMDYSLTKLINSIKKHINS